MIHKIKSSFRFFRILCIRALTGGAQKMTISDCVVLAPHPDDETLGCGSLIAATVNARKRVEIVVFSNGTASHNGCCDITPEVLERAREADTIKALTILGVAKEHVHFLHLQDGNLTTEISVHKSEILELLSSLGIKTVLVPHPQEGWSDHEAVSALGDALQSSGWTRFYYCVWFYFSMPFKKFHKVAWQHAYCIKDAASLNKKIAGTFAEEQFPWYLGGEIS